MKEVKTKPKRKQKTSDSKMVERANEIINKGLITELAKNVYLIESASGNKSYKGKTSYKVSLESDKYACQCIWHIHGRKQCKHILAAILYRHSQ